MLLLLSLTVLVCYAWVFHSSLILRTLYLNVNVSFAYFAFLSRLYHFHLFLYIINRFYNALYLAHFHNLSAFYFLVYLVGSNGLLAFPLTVYPWSFCLAIWHVSPHCISSLCVIFLCPVHFRNCFTTFPMICFNKLPYLLALPLSLVFIPCCNWSHLSVDYCLLFGYGFVSLTLPYSFNMLLLPHTYAVTPMPCWRPPLVALVAGAADCFPSPSLVSC